MITIPLARLQIGAIQPYEKPYRLVVESTTATDDMSAEMHAATTDPVTLEESLLAGWRASFSDPFSLEDRLTSVVRFVRAEADPVQTEDHLTSAAHFARTQKDHVGVADATMYAARSTLPDTIPVMDRVVAHGAAPLSHPVSTHDHLKSATLFAWWDAAGVADAMTVTLRLPHADKAMPLDHVTVHGGAPLSDDVSIEDHLAHAARFIRTEADATMMGDQLTSFSRFVRTTGDLFGVADSLVHDTSLSRIETATVTDPSTARAVLGGLDAVATGDQLIHRTRFARTQADPVDTHDHLANVVGFIRTEHDPVGVQETLTHGAQLAHPDTITMTDWPASHSALIWRDSITLNNPLSGATMDAHIATDPVGTHDQLTRVASFVRADVEPVGAWETCVCFSQSSRPDIITTLDRWAARSGVLWLDSVGVADELVSAASFVRAMVDSAGTNDHLTRVVNFVRTQVDPAVVLESITHRAYIPQQDTATAMDHGTMQGEMTCPDVINIGDQLTYTADFVRTHVDAAEMTDTTIGRVASPVSPDVFSVTDTLESRLVGSSVVGQSLLGEAVFNQ